LGYYICEQGSQPVPIMAATDHRETRIWDVPTRLFHWSLVLLVGSNLFLIGPGGGVETVIHFFIGYLIAGLLLFRMAWGFIGSPRSRFADFVRSWPTVEAYIQRLRALKPPRSIGHNPLGGWMIVLLLVTLATMVGTGLFASSRHAAGPFAHLIPVGTTAAVGNIHQLISNFLIGLIIVHIAGVGVEWLLTGENLVKAMMNGRKRLSPELADVERPTAPARRAALVGVVCLAIVAGLAAATDFSASRASLQAAAVRNTSSAPAPGTSTGN
jgi:cytochrome b